MNIPFDLNKIADGKEFEIAVTEYLKNLGFDTRQTGINDFGVDIIASIKLNHELSTFNIQCKFHNKTISNGPIQEVYAGSVYHNNNGYPVVIVKNDVTVSARTYAKKLGVEIISEPEWGMLRDYMSGTRKQTWYIGPLLKTIIAIKLDNPQILKKLTPEEEYQIAESERLKEEALTKIKLLEDLEAKEDEHRRLAGEFRRQHTRLLKEIILKNLDYG